MAMLHIPSENLPHSIFGKRLIESSECSMQHLHKIHEPTAFAITCSVVDILSILNFIPVLICPSLVPSLHRVYIVDHQNVNALIPTVR